MASLADFAGKWVAIDADHNVVASGETPCEAEQRARRNGGDRYTSIARVSTQSPHMLLPLWPLEPVRALADTELWLAGGPVRDLLMGRRPRDWDFVVPRHAIALGRATANVMGGAFYVLDSKRGTGRAIVSEPDTGASISLDFATLRASTIQADLRLRDFTINAMAITPDGEWIDPTGGQQDLDDGRVRLTHPGCLRRDPVRLIRAVRMATELDLSLAPEAARQIQVDAASLHTVAAERIRDELVKIFSSSRPGRGLCMLSDLGLLTQILPEVNGRVASVDQAANQDSTVSRHIDELLDIVCAMSRGVSVHGKTDVSPAPCAADLATLEGVMEAYCEDLVGYFSEHVGGGLTRRDLAPWCALYLPQSDNRATAQRCGTEAEGRLAALRFSVHAQTFVSRSVHEAWRFDELRKQAQANVGAPRRVDLYRYFRATGESGVMTALLCVAQDDVDASIPRTVEGHQANLLALCAVLTAYFRRRREIVDPKLLLTGQDLLQMGFPESPELGKALEALREAQASGEVTTEAQARAWVAPLAAGQ